jgi:hypothetical protein
VRIFKRSVDQILSGFSKTIDELNQARDEAFALEEANRQKAISLIADAEAANTEGVRASTVAHRLTGLIGG